MSFDMILCECMFGAPYQNTIPLLIATHNSAKRNSLTRLVLAAQSPFGIIEFNKNIPAPKEIGHNEQENALSKAQYYATFFPGMNVLSVDDGLYIDALHTKDQIGERIKRIGQNIEMSPSELNSYWWDRLGDKGSLPAIRQRAIVIRSLDGELFQMTHTLPVRLVRPALRPTSTTDNVLNHFMVPVGYNIPICSLTSKEIVSLHKPVIRFLKKTATIIQRTK